ncbi:DNA polymerase III subunit delta' [Azorhizobium oxalatiphilum]|uniref:DNA polymerase III subunit delta n=1 Tax=Azorhizobium oxalatiphilum TaxID=980631 RepID=A0A917BXC1_9HYPH|nr:DNA polymerase III subunit delta' [Azorhizobium oxalatiphilum]GGF59303.1 DNA polymerase III subunit delta' [Azorhizobium oxalatiphilum]
MARASADKELTEGPEGDILPGAPHPRRQDRLFGHAAVEADLIAEWRAGRLPHGLLIGGPEGIGKATLAYRIARFVLAGGEVPTTQHAFDVPGSHPVARQVAALTHPDLLVLRRVPEPGEEKIPTVIPAEMVRKVRAFFGATAGSGGWRVCIVDAVDDLNAFGANALLKTLEEPPPRALFLLITHAPGRVLPTIRSRTRKVLLKPLGGAEVLAALDHLAPELGLEPDALPAAAAASGGSVRRAIVLARGEGMEVRGATLRALEQLPDPRMEELHALGARLQGDRGDGLDLFLEAVSDWIAAEATSGAASGRRLVRLGEVWENVQRNGAAADTYNLDRKALVFRIFSELAEAARA